MGFDGAELQRLEAVYLASRNEKDLEPMYSALLIAGKVLLKSYLSKIGLRLSLDRRQEVVHDATTRLLSQYLKKPEQESIPLVSRMHLELLYQLHNPSQVKIDQQIELTPQHSLPLYEEESTEPVDYVTMIGSDETVQGKRIIVDLHRNRYYKRAILTIAEYTPKAWIYNHAVELHTIWQILKMKGGRRYGRN